MNKLRTLLLLLIQFVWVSMAADDTTFNPTNPPEPNDIYVAKHNVTVTSSPTGKGYTSGTGRYAEGATITISTSSAVANWVFQYWEMDGERDETHTSASFSYTLGTQDVTFTAVYEYVEPTSPDDPDDPDPELPPFTPNDPAEPETPVFPDEPDTPDTPVVTPKYTLTLVSDPFEACAFNISTGKTYEAETNITLKATGNQSFVFNGWYDDEGTLLAETTSFGYTMPERDATVTAKWTFTPDAPGDPTSTQEIVANPNIIYGDVNGDNSYTISDVFLTIEYIMDKTPSNGLRQAADSNQDKEITISDIFVTISKIMSSTDE